VTLLTAAAATWLWWPSAPSPAAPAADGDATEPVHDRSRTLAQTRLKMDARELERFIAEQSARAGQSSDPAEWRVLGEAHLERVLLESSRLGMAVGKPTFADTPEVVTANLDAGEAAIAKARAGGDRHSEVARIEAGLKANRMTGVMSAMRIGREVEKLVEEAATRGSGNPHVAVLRGCRLAFTPKWLGGDPTRALPLFERAADQLTHDERPLVFAAFTAHVLGNAEAALRHLRAAVARNPANAYAREVVRRLEAGEDRAFERDLAR
jgi:hypothetical protein